MDVYERSLRLQEYDTLRTEILQSKQYVFERPLLIITAIGITLTQYKDESTIISILPIIILITLLANLSFTVSRLRSFARIAAYIQVVLEPGSEIKWIGWENALRNSRICSRECSKSEFQTMVDKEIGAQKMPETVMFYPPIYWFHFIMVIITLVLSFLSVDRIVSIMDCIPFLITLVLGIIFLLLCVFSYRPGKKKNLIEIQRATWSVVFRKYSKKNSLPDRVDSL
jgi:hypothetical protein